MTEHVPDELPALLDGQLPRPLAAGVVAHLHACEDCRHRLVGFAAASGALRFSARALAAPTASPLPATSGQTADEFSLPPLRHLDSRRGGRRLLAAAAVFAALAAAGGLGWAVRNPGPEPAVQAAGQGKVATARLTSLSGGPASGEVTMRQPDPGTDMTVATVGLRAPSPGEFYEVWLLDPATSKMVSIGVLAPDGRATLRLPATLINAYHAIDVSLQRDNGDPRHSSRSVLRGRYS